MKKRIILPVVILLVLMGTFIGSVSFFSYAQKGNTENSIQMGDLTFKYTEVSKIGHGINLNEGYPMSEADGKVLEEYFDFKVESNLSRSDLEYSVEIDTTLSEIPDSGIRVYLVEVVNGEEKEISNIVNLLSSYETSEDGRIIYKETIPRNTENYEKNFRLRLWIDESIDWTDDEYIGHSGIYKVNVKANSDTSMASSDVVTDRTATIERVVANNKYLFTESSDESVDYEVTVPYTVNNIDIEVYESNTQATSETTKLNSLEGVSSRTENQNISTGNNYFKTVVTASNGRNEEEYILKVVKEADPRNDLLNLGVEGYSLTPSFDPNVTEYTLILEEPSINITGTPVSGIASISGTGEKNLVFGENVFDIVVTSESNVSKTYTITVDNQRPIAPTITGGTGSEIWVSTNPTISLADNNTAFAISGIDHYEVYDTDTSTAPIDNTEATSTTQGNYEVSTNGVHYIYYRTVSNKEFKSVWSSAQVVMLDTSPNPGILASAPSTANSITANYGAASSPSGIKSTTCYYGTTNNPTTAGTVSGNNCVFSSLAANTTYYFKKCVTNNVDVTTCSAVSNKLTAGQVYNYAYTGNYQTFTVPVSGNYKVELWGAQGGTPTSDTAGGKGGYTTGTISLTRGTNLYIYVGEAGKQFYKTCNSSWNGGGTSCGINREDYLAYHAGSGGGATDVRLTAGAWNNFNSLKSRIMVAAGGGGGYNYGDGVAYGGYGGAGGGITGGNGTVGRDPNGRGYKPGYGASQTAGGSSGGSFGNGGAGTEYTGGGGGGYYGGGAGTHVVGGGGGSSFISGYSGCNAISVSSTSSNIVHTGQPNHYSGYVFTSVSMTAGNRTGSGYARITITYIN